MKTSNVNGSASIISSMRSANAIKLALYRKKAKVNPAPHIPKTYDEIINATLSAKYTQTHDGADFLRSQCWTTDSEDKGMIMFQSDFSAELLKTHSTWLLDGTFKSVPKPFAQVHDKYNIAFISYMTLFQL